MERERRIRHLLLTLTSCLCLGCTAVNGPEHESAYLTLKVIGADLITRTGMPDEDALKSPCVMIFDEDGHLEWMSRDVGDGSRIRLYTGHSYTLFAYANIDHGPEELSMEGVISMKHSITSYEDCHRGIPMSCMVSDVMIEDDTEMVLELERLMSKVSLRIDRSWLSEDVVMNVERISIGNCPSQADVFGQSRVRKGDRTLNPSIEASGVMALNRGDHNEMSEEVSLYMFENMQTLNEENLRKEAASYIEMGIRYLSDSLYCTDSLLIYRFYLGDGPGNMDVERNCHYHITVKPEDKGIPDDAWRVEKSGLRSFVQNIHFSEDTICLSYKGEMKGIEAEILPPEAYIRDVLWKSSDDSIITVDRNGRITAQEEGQCDVSCFSLDGSGIMDSCHIICEFAPPHFISYPENKYIRGDIGDTVRLWCDVFPPNTPFDVGMEYLEADKAEGIYDFIVDDDGHGVTLVLTGPGTGLIYMEAGAPVNEAELFFIEVNLPENTAKVTGSDSAQYVSPHISEASQEYRQRPDYHLRLQPPVRDLSPSLPHG